MTARKSKFISHTANGTHFSPTFLTGLCKMTLLFTLIYFFKKHIYSVPKLTESAKSETLL